MSSPNILHNIGMADDSNGQVSDDETVNVIEVTAVLLSGR